MRRIVLLVLVAVILSLPVFAGGQPDTSDQVSLEFFQNKPEAVDTFDALLEDFMAEFPHISVTQNQVPEAETVLMTRLTSNRMPPAIAANANATFGEIARSGAFKDWRDNEVSRRVHDAYIDMTQRLVGDMDAIYGIPFTANANTVLYNIEIFEEHGIDVPMTWSELIAAADQLQAAGVQPFFHAFADSWTTMVPWNALAANIQDRNFPELLATGQSSFSAQYREVAEKMLILLEYGGSDNFGFGYSDGNQAFARGTSAMLIQGVWAIGEVLQANPNINLGVFALPVREQASENLLVSGVDTIFAIAPARNQAEAEAAEQLIEFLTRDDSVYFYIHEERQFPAIQNVVQEDPVMDGIRVYFEEGRLSYFPDHYYPAGMAVADMNIEFLQHGDVDRFLRDLDEEYQMITDR